MNVWLQLIVFIYLCHVYFLKLIASHTLPYLTRFQDPPRNCSRFCEKQSGIGIALWETQQVLRGSRFSIPSPVRSGITHQPAERASLISSASDHNCIALDWWRSVMLGAIQVIQGDHKEFYYIWFRIILNLF